MQTIDNVRLPKKGEILRFAGGISVAHTVTDQYILLWCTRILRVFHVSQTADLRAALRETLQ